MSHAVEILAHGLGREWGYFSSDFLLLWGGWITELKMFLVFSRGEYFWKFFAHSLAASMLTTICIIPWALGFVCQLSGWYILLDLLERKLLHA